MREKGAINVTLYNGTQEKRFLEDLKGVSDKVVCFYKANRNQKIKPVVIILNL